MVRGSGYYFIVVCTSLDTLATVRYVEVGIESSKISKILKDSKRALRQNRQSLESLARERYARSPKMKDGTRARLTASVLAPSRRRQLLLRAAPDLRGYYVAEMGYYALRQICPLQPNRR